MKKNDHKIFHLDSEIDEAFTSMHERIITKLKKMLVNVGLPWMQSWSTVLTKHEKMGITSNLYRLNLWF